MTLALGLSLAACGNTTTARGDGPLVLATTPIWADVTSQVTCSRLEVDSVVPAGVDPHDFELDVRDADRVGSADVLIANGLGLEENLSSAIERARDSGVEVVEVGPALDPLQRGADNSDPHSDHPDQDDREREHDGAHDHGDHDPHVWMDPSRVATAASLISEQLRASEAVSLSDDELTECTEAYIAELQELEAELDKTFSALDETTMRLVTDHEALGYLEDRFDVEVIGTVIPSTSSLGETNPRDVEDLAKTMRSAGVTRVIGKVADPSALESTLSRAVGAPVSVERLDIETLGAPGGPSSYVELMQLTGAVVSGR